MSLRAGERCCLTTASPDNPSKETWSALIEDSHLFFSPNDFITEDKLWIEGTSLKELGPTALSWAAARLLLWPGFGTRLLAAEESPQPANPDWTEKTFKAHGQGLILFYRPAWGVRRFKRYWH